MSAKIREPRAFDPAMVVRAIIEAALLVLAAGVAILLLGLPVALLGRGLHDLIAWIAGR